jgi:chaperone BCS1
MGKNVSPLGSKSNIISQKKKVWSIMSSIIFLFNIFEKFFSNQLHRYVTKYMQKFISFMSPYIQITFPDLKSAKHLKRSEAYTCIKTYLSLKSSERAKRFNAEVVENNQTPLVLTLGDNEELMDEFNGVKVWWVANNISQNDSDEKSSLTLTFDKRYRDLITTSYIQHVLQEGKMITMKNRKLKLYTNNPSDDWWKIKKKWSSITFEHPATFETLAMDPKKKEEIIDDLIKFKTGKEYYTKVGKAWKRGYLLFGPPGTGKSTMISAMANFMNYDVYDLELTTIKDNNDLKRLLITTSSKSIIVIEDIDCSIDLTGKRKKKKDHVYESKYYGTMESKVTLSGLLNFIDGIWSACGGERIIIFTTNFVDKLDHALIRRGRMDMHIEMSYCTYEAFKVLAKNYWDVESHDGLFPIIQTLIGETNMTPADVAENLMPKSITEDFETCLKNLIQSLENAKKMAEEKANEKVEYEDEEAQLKVEEDKQALT